MENLFLFAIILVNVLFSSKGFNDESFFRKYQFHVGSIRAGEQFRMISSAFLHVDIMHLAFNMLTLWFFAPVVSGFLGNLYIFLYSFLFPGLRKVRSPIRVCYFMFNRTRVAATAARCPTNELNTSL